MTATSDQLSASEQDRAAKSAQLVDMKHALDQACHTRDRLEDSLRNANRRLQALESLEQKTATLGEQLAIANHRVESAKEACKASQVERESAQQRYADLRSREDCSAGKVLGLQEQVGEWRGRATSQVRRRPLVVSASEPRCLSDH